ncbi:ATP-binding protein [uncultured Jatrophihabitans sp.]|uniref:HAMP domain-containing sensor histidine kinase n=1 Tax=uncultured Jatrophihabitans sp. TaxID=1610747 RepID=UPI0035CC5164
MRRRILLLVVGMTVLVVLAFAIPLTVLIRSTVAEDVRNDVRNEALRARGAVQSYPPPSTSTLTTYVRNRVKATGWPISITLPSGQVIGSTPADNSSVPTQRGEGDDGRGGYGGPGTGGGPGPDLQPVKGGSLDQTVSFSSAGPYVVRVYLPDGDRYDGENSKFLLLAGAAVVLIGVGIGAGEVLTRRIVRPLADTAATAQQLSAGDTTARAPTDGPVEVADVGRALNRLADRIDELIAEERETVADLSHRLRTPLTALRLDAEALDEPREAERIGGHVTTLERMLTAVIRAARRPQREGRMPASDATEVVGERVAFWSALTEDQGRVATVELPRDPLPVRAGAEDLAAAVDALLENVVAHTPEGTPFSVLLAATTNGARLTVADDGPGLPPDEPVRGRSDRGSSGLGLDIARRSAQASGGSMTLGASPSGGASITLLFGRP